MMRPLPSENMMSQLLIHKETGYSSADKDGGTFAANITGFRFAGNKGSTGSSHHKDWVTASKIRAFPACTLNPKLDTKTSVMLRNFLKNNQTIQVE
jgi:hypothetical protein